ncbi:MAG TPA: condensation domain-containing protein [Pyrinomonadaceae bacterium]
MSEEMLDQTDSCDVAIIGMAGRFPRAANLEEFWQNLRDGVEGISFFSDDDLEVVMDPQDLLNPNLVKAKGVLDDVDLFDAPFFNISTREAQVMDPQQRLFLESAWTAIESAGYDVSTYPGQISIYAGVNTNTYLLSRLEQLGIATAADYFSLSLANEKDHLTTRVSYKLNLRGESIAVQTSCSTSLVAVHLACQSLLSGQSDMALAGGVSIRVPQRSGYFYQEGMIMSPDGHCRAFDERAKGTVPGHGVGIVVLKLLSDAIRDGDSVRAVIKGSAINNDGHLKMGYTAPSVEGQADVIGKALAIAGVDAETISYVEAHGTGTPLGDPIEVEALARAFRQQTQRRGFCALGAVKSNIGHLDNAAGVAGLIKTVLALEHKQIPPTLHFEKSNPMIDFDQTPFTPNSKLREWTTDGFPRRAGVSSFGIGGTNAHVILEEAPALQPVGKTRKNKIVTLSARTGSALEKSIEMLAQHLRHEPQVELADVAYTRNVGRQSFPYKHFIVASNNEEAVKALSAAKVAVKPNSTQSTPRVAFMFPGQGTQAVGMARELLQSEPEFAARFTECADLLKTHHDVDVRQLIYPDGEGGPTSTQSLAQPQFALPALFTIEYALARLWISWGIKPDAMIGHSFGEYVAACLAEVFTLPDALTLVVSRGRLMQQLSPGAMTVVRLSEAELQSYLSGDVAISAVNSPGICTASGPIEQIDGLESRLSKERVAYRRIDVPYAYHSSSVDSILPEFERVVSAIKRQAPVIPYISNVTGSWITPEEVVSTSYWLQQMRQTVRFARGIETLVHDQYTAFLEIGSGQTLGPLVKPQIAKDQERFVVASLSHTTAIADEEVMLKSLGRFWQAGCKVDWSGFYRFERRRRLSLPTYPFERQRYWIEAPGHKAFNRSEAATHTVVTLPDAVSPRVENTTPEPAPTRSPLLGEYIAPRNEVELTLSRIWSDVLGQAQIGVEDNFFDLGGDSLLATQVYARVKQAFAVDISLQEMFEHQLISDLSLAIQAVMQDQTPGANYEPIRPAVHDGVTPLSFAQEWFWVLDQFEPGTAVYNLPSAARLTGPLHVDALSRSLSEIVRRHSVLHSVFREVDGQPAQITIPAPEFSLPLIDFSELSEIDRETAARDLVAAEVSRPFDLAHGPIIRASLIRIADEDHMIVIVIHHIAFDAWSSGLLIREIATLYEAFSKGENSPLSEPPIQYADYAAWQRESLSDAVMDAQLSYWTRQLNGAPPVLELPLDRPRPAVPSYDGARQSFSLPADLSAELRELARREQVTLFMLLLAGLNTLLARLSGQDDISVGMPIAGRGRVELEGLIGCFINTLVLRTQLAPSLKFRELLQKVRETTLEAYAHQDLPFVKLLATLKPERRPGTMPLYQVLLDVVNAPTQAVPMSDLTLSPVTSDQGTAKVDLILDVWDSSNGIVIMAEYKTALFDRETIARMLRGFETLLSSIVAHPDERLSALEIVSETDKQAKLAEQNERADRLRQKFITANPRSLTLS